MTLENNRLGAIDRQILPGRTHLKKKKTIVKRRKYIIVGKTVLTDVPKKELKTHLAMNRSAPLNPFHHRSGDLLPGLT